MSTKSIRTEKIFFKKNFIFKYYPVRNESSN